MSEQNAVNRALISRVLFGVTSVGAALGLLYLYYTQQRKKDAEADSNNSTTSKRKRRVASGSGEKNRVTFADKNEIIETSNVKGIDDEEDEELESPVVVAASVKNFEVQKKQSPIPISPLPKTVNAEPLISPKKTQEEQINQINNEAPNKASVKLNESTEQLITEVTPGNEELVEVQEPVFVALNGHPSSIQQQPGNSAITPETDYDNSSKIRHIEIPREFVAGLIGRKGSNIKMIQQNSNTVINFRDETLENGDRVCVIRGLPQDVTLAESMIEKYLLEQPVVGSHTMTIPQSCVGRIIGKGGESIRMIQDLSKAKVIVDSGTNHYRGGGDVGSTKNVFIKGTEEQIETARQMILSKVEEEQTLRRNIDIATQNRTPRRPTNSTSSNSPGGSANQDLSGINGNSLPLKTNGVMEVFVSCAYHPNDFWIQVMGRESIELDRLAESMTDWYTQLNLAGANDTEEYEFSVGEIIAAPFDVDGKMYRGKVLKIEEDGYEVIYVDYGDKRVLTKPNIQKLHPEFLKLRFQAKQATLNLGCIEERWTDEAINEFCDMTYCAQWQSLTAKVKDYLKDPNDQRDTIWIELIDKDSSNIGDELVRRGLACQINNSQSTNGASSSSKKSYAAVVADEIKSPSSDNVQDGSAEQTWDDDEYNGN